MTTDTRVSCWKTSFGRKIQDENMGFVHCDLVQKRTLLVSPLNLPRRTQRDKLVIPLECAKGQNAAMSLIESPSQLCLT